MTFRTVLIGILAFGLIPSTAFLVIFAVIDRPRRWTLHAKLVLGLVVAVWLQQVRSVGALLAGRPTPTPTGFWQWFTLLGMSGSVGLLMCALLAAYRRPPDKR